MATQKEVKNRIASVKNIHKITRAMEMVAAARLRRAEQRIDAMRPYAQAIRKMTQQVADAAETLEKIKGGDWSDDTQSALRTSIEQFADDFGYDLDEDGQPLSEDDQIRAEEGRRGSSSDEDAEREPVGAEA